MPMAKRLSAINFKRENENPGEATVTPPVSLANRRVGFCFKIFQWIWTTAAGQSIVGVNLKLVSIGLDVLRMLDLDVPGTLDLNYFSRILVVFVGSVAFDRINWFWFISLS